MPQMAPLNWLGLFITFIVTFIVFNLLTYYVFTYPPKSYKTEVSTSKINWKW
uniref:ATP synthase complex subunit 8 n=1 Tax=Bolboceratex sp. BOL01 TaxID=1205609 RepID=A0A0S2MNM5_9SCAR|nr:ATP synthase F0 subunit 8 [Bolboceratex sp. BOL01]